MSVCLGRVRHTVMLHSRVCPGVDIKMKLVCPTRSHTRACDLAVLHKSVYPPVFTRSGTRACPRPCDTRQYVCPVSIRPETRVYLELWHTAFHMGV
ncbi:MutS [Gossypium arboreum]|uniref:MutS n=1 Tax=Gossypium arboreum TaxID=29729 RepID=A0A0B0MAF0_GOSAR|nr:MutS [Gossypium arboreum]